MVWTSFLELIQKHINKSSMRRTALAYVDHNIRSGSDRDHEDPPWSGAHGRRYSEVEERYDTFTVDYAERMTRERAQVVIADEYFYRYEQPRTWV